MDVIVYQVKKQHIYELVKGLQQAGIDYRFLTGFFASKSLTGLPVLGKLLKLRYDPLIDSRRVIQLTPLEEIFFTLWARTGIGLRKRNRALFRYFLHFQKKALPLLDKAKVVISFHTNAFYSFQFVNSVKILETVQPHPFWIMELYRALKEKYPWIEKTLPLNYTPLIAGIFAKEFELSDFIIVPSNFLKSTLQKFKVPVSKIKIIPHGFYGDVKNLKRSNASLSGRLKVVYTGIITPVKGFHYLIEVAKRAERICEFYIFGRKVYKGFPEDLPSNVHLLGWRSREELFKAYYSFEIFYFPTLYDASGLALIEAMAHGLVPIASRYSAAPDMIKHGKNGFLIYPHEIEKTVEILNWLYKHRNEIPEISREVIEAVKPFTWENYREEYIRLVKTYINKIEK